MLAGKHRKTKGKCIMAFVSDGFRLSVTLVDTGNDKSVKGYDLRAADMDEAIANAALFMTDLAAATLCAISGYSIAEVYTQDALTAPTSAGARNSMQAVITADIADNPLKHGTIVIPGPVADVFVAASGSNSDVVNAAHAVVTNLVDNFKALGTVFVSDGEDIDVNPNIKGVRRTVFRRLAK
jgi:hypothetical protein